MTLSLDFLPQSAFAYMLIFARIGAMTMALPGIGDRTVPPRVRLVFALVLSLTLFPLVATAFPPLPTAINGMVAALVGEAIIGIAIGFAVRMIVSTIQFAGAAIAFQIGLAFAQSVDPVNGVHSTLVGTFLSVLSVALIFAADLHHLLLAAMHHSYLVFRPGGGFPVGDMAEVALRILTDGFRVSIQIAAPFLVFGLIFYLGVGVLTRLIPQVQVFFLAMPANILLGLLLLMLLISSLMMWFLDYFQQALSPFLA